jgi:hypothetical protein
MRVNAERTTRVRRAVAVTAAFTLFAGCFSAAHSQAPTNYGTYIITNVHSGLALSDPGSSNTDAEFVQQLSVTNGTNQQWVVTNNGDGSFTLTNASSGQYLDVNGASRASGALVDQYPSNGNANQNWIATSLGGGHYEVTSQNSSLALGVVGGGTNSGAEINQATYTGSASQQWVFTPLAPATGGIRGYGCIGACHDGGEVEGFHGIPPDQGYPGTTTFQLTALASGSWNSAGEHLVGNYQIGHSTQLPNQQVSYFEFNFSPVQGRTVTAAFFLIPGSTDYDIGTNYHSTECPAQPAPCFKVGIRPQGSFSTAEIVDASSNNNRSLASAAIGNQNEDLGYGWVADGLHLGVQFSAYTFNTQNLQNQVNAGGLQVVWGADDFDSGESNLSGGGSCPACPGGVENYIWGGTGYNTGIIALITVEGGEASIPVVPNGIYEVKNLNSGAALEVASAKTYGAQLDQSDYTGSGKQLWKVARLVDGNYTITNVGTGQQLDASNSTRPWEPAHIMPADKTANQEWTISPTTNGNYTIKSVRSELLLDVASAKTLNGAGIVLGSAQNGYAHQQWSFKPSNANQQASLIANEAGRAGLQ